MIVQGHYPHDVLRLAGAGFIRNELDGTTYIEPDTFDESRIPDAIVQAAKNAKVAELSSDYQSEIIVPLSYMGYVFQADTDSQATLNKVLTALSATGATPAGFYWVDSENNQIPMTFAQLQGLALAMLTRGWTAFQKLQALKGQVRAATTMDQITAVGWV